jgi:hypothetical protein
MPGPRAYPISAAVVHQIIQYVRAGGFPHVAAEAAGIPAEVYHVWLRRGAGRSDNKLYRLLLHGVRRARAEARLAAEVTLFKEDPLSWLKHGPGKETADSPGWSSPPRPFHEAPDQPAAPDDYDPWTHQVVCALLRILSEDEDLLAKARQAVAAINAQRQAAEAERPGSTKPTTDKLARAFSRKSAVGTRQSAVHDGSGGRPCKVVPYPLHTASATADCPLPTADCQPVPAPAPVPVPAPAPTPAPDCVSPPRPPVPDCALSPPAPAGSLPAHGPLSPPDSRSTPAHAPREPPFS